MWVLRDFSGIEALGFTPVVRLHLHAIHITFLTLFIINSPLSYFPSTVCRYFYDCCGKHRPTSWIASEWRLGARGLTGLHRLELTLWQNSARKSPMSRLRLQTRNQTAEDKIFSIIQTPRRVGNSPVKHHMIVPIVPVGSVMLVVFRIIGFP